MAGPFFDAESQIVAAAGFATISVNARGAGGAGTPFADAANPDRLGIPMRDAARAIDTAIEEFPYLRADRLGLLGLSAGALVGAWTLGHSPRFRAAVFDRGTFDLLAQALLSDSGWLVGRTLDADPIDAAPLLWSQSPLRLAPRISVPVLLLHGAADRRCPPSQSEAFLAALRSERKELVLYPREGHALPSLGEPNHRIDRLVRIGAWFREWLA